MPNETLVLIVEDDNNDVFMLQRAFQQAGITNPVHVARSGEDAIAYLAGNDPYSDWNKFPLPSIVLLDLALPGLSGLDVLIWIRKTSGLHALRVAVVTDSCSGKEVRRAYELGANGCFPKLGDYHELIEMMKNFRLHWLEYSRAPEVFRTRQQSEPTSDETPRPSN